MKKLVAFVALILVSLVVGTATAAVYTVDPTVSGRTAADTIGFTGGEVIVGNWSDGQPSKEKTSWLKYNIPSYPGEVITNVLLNTNIVGVHNVCAGIDITYVPDDSWAAGTMTSTWLANEGTLIIHRSAYDNTSCIGTAASSDITSWLSFTGEGEGETLSIRLTRRGGGNRGSMCATPTLTITTVPGYDSTEEAVAGIVAILDANLDGILTSADLAGLGGAMTGAEIESALQSLDPPVEINVSSAISAGDADTVDGQHASAFTTKLEYDAHRHDKGSGGRLTSTPVQ